MDFIERLLTAQAAKQSLAVLGVDPQLDSRISPGIPTGYDLSRFSCEIVETAARVL